MKKSILTVSFVVLCAIAANAQDTKTKKTKEQKPVENSATNSATVSGTEMTAPAAETTPAKKSGTRMAINEKGMPGNTKNSSATPASAKKEEKTTTTSSPK